MVVVSGLTNLDGNYSRFPEKALWVAALFASLSNSLRIELSHWARAQEIAERWRAGTHELYSQLNEIDTVQQSTNE